MAKEAAVDGCPLRALKLRDGFLSHIPCSTRKGGDCRFNDPPVSPGSFSELDFQAS